MIDKVAEMTRLAEVRGCMAAFHDAGLIKVASDQAFDGLCEEVASRIGYDYDLEKIAAATDSLLSRIARAFRGDSIKAGKTMVADSKSWGQKLTSSKKDREAMKALGEKMIRKGRIEQALAYGGAGTLGAGGLAGAAYGANAYLND